MKLTIKKVFAVIFALIIVSISCSVNAVDVTVGSLTISAPTEVNQGEEFTVTVNLSNFQTSASTVTVIGKIDYEKDKLEYISNSISSNTEEGWDDIKALGEQSFRESNMAFILENRTPSKIGANSNLLTLKFKAKADIEGSSTITVNVNSVSDATNFNGNSTTISITKEQVNPDTDPGQQPGDEPGTQPGDEPGTQPETQPEQQPDKDNGSKTPEKDNTTKPGTLPKTGVNYALWDGIIVSAFIVTTISCVYGIVRYNKKTQE